MPLADKLNPTREQAAIIDAARAGKHVVIQAGAGTGKTSTLRMVADALGARPAIYVAYNRAIAAEAAADFPSHVTCRTAHALAMAAVGRTYRHRLGGPRQPARRAAELLGTVWLDLRRDLQISPVQLARIAIETVRAFCYSADDDIAAKHVPAQNGIGGADHTNLAAAVLPYARRAWSDLCDPGGCCASSTTTFTGLEGCVRYKASRTDVLYTQGEYREMVAQLPLADILVTHCPPTGINDHARDPAHNGIDALLPWLEQFTPRVLIHGHTYPRQPVRRHGPTRIEYVHGGRIIDF